MDTAAATVARLLDTGAPSATVISRATWFRTVAWAGQARRAPVVGGRTVWEAIPDGVRLSGSAVQVVVEQPNYFGRLETPPGPAAKVITVARWIGVPRYQEAGVKDPHGEVSPMATVRHLGGALRQIRGLTFPHGPPETPWFVVSLPAKPTEAAAALTSAGFGDCWALGLDYPEFPGGLRIAVAWPQSENQRFVRTLRAALNI